MTVHSGIVRSVLYCRGGFAYVTLVDGSRFRVRHSEADKALPAVLLDTKSTIEIHYDTQGGEWQTSTIKIPPTVVVRARGKVRSVSLADETEARTVIHVGGPQYYSVYGEDNARASALAMHGDFEVEIVSVDGGPDTVRLP